MSKPIEDPLESLENTMATDARDWATNFRDAWLYGIVCGWGDAIYEVAEKHKWSMVEVYRLKRLHDKFVALKEKP